MVLKKYDQNQSKFICFNPINNIPKNHVCFLVDEIVESLDFDEVNGKYEGTPGQKAFNRKMFVKMDVMGTIDHIFSSRKVCEQLMYNDVYKFLSGGEKVDFRTLCRVRKECDELYTKALFETVYMGIKLGIVSMNHLGVDGSYLKGNASVSKLFSEDDFNILTKLMDQRNKVDKEEGLLFDEKTGVIVDKDSYDIIDELMKDDLFHASEEEFLNHENDDIDEEGFIQTFEDNNLKLEDVKPKKISNKIKKVAEKALEGNQSVLDRIDRVQSKFDENWQKKVNMTDPDTFAMKNKKKVYQSLYNVQFACDYDSKFIIANMISNSPVDNNQLIPFLEYINETYGIENIGTISADSAYNNGKNLTYLENNDINGLIPNKYQASCNKNKDYENLNKFHKNNFTYDFDQDSYLCPMGIELPLKNDYGEKKVYYTNKCKECSKKEECKKKSNTRVITAYKSEQSMQRMKIKMQNEKNIIEYKKRAPAVESPIGDIKHNNKMIEFSTRGNKNVKIEVDKVSISHNLRIIAKYIMKNAESLSKIGLSLADLLVYIQNLENYFEYPNIWMFN